MMASVVVRGNRRKSLTLRGVDPETCMIVFKNHWAQVVKILEKHEPGRSSTGALSFLSGHSSSGGSRLGPIPADEASAVQNYVEHMLFLLMEEEAGQGGAMGPILELVVLEGVMERLFLWSLRRQFTEDMKLEQLRMYQMLLSQARQPLLHHKPVLRPLMMLLASCAGAATGEDGGVVEAELVLLLNQLCVALVKDPSVLELFFHTSEDQGAANFLLFSLLIPYTHRQGSVGQQARDALLLIMSLSASEPRVAQHIAQNTYFCPVLATGLSGLYSSLPARLQVYSEDWHCLDRADWQQILVIIMNMNNMLCVFTLLSYIYNGFLVPVLAPALHKLTVEEVMTTTAYLDLFLRSVSEPALLQTFLSFILLHRHENVHILDTLVSRVNTPFQLGTVSLALFRTLIGLFCEDVMLQLVFRYLLPCSHLSRRQRCSLQQTDCYSCSASSLLLLLPSWCPQINILSMTTGYVFQHASLEMRSSSLHQLGLKKLFQHCSNYPMDGSYLFVRLNPGGDFSLARQCTSTTFSLMFWFVFRACRFWSAPYDGVDPPPQTSSALELEWDDIFADEDSSAVINMALTNGGVNMETDRFTVSPAPLPLLPRHIQEMRRNATRLVHGAYVEESEFQDDVLVYDLVAQKDTKAAILERIMAANRRTPTNTLSNGHVESQSCDLTITNGKSPSLPDNRVANGSDFLSQYHELMLSLGVEPDCDDITDDIGTFRKRVRALRQKLVEDEEELSAEFGFSSLWEDAEEEEEMEEEEEEERMKSGSRKHGVPFTGPFISVLLSRLENLLENSIAVNLLVTGILAQLASYPQPLLRSFLLCTDQHHQPNVRTLYQVLVSVHAQIEHYVAARPDYPALLTEAWRFLLAKDQDEQWRAKSRVFAIVLFAEFLKEMAAIAQEHSIALDWSAKE
uniref:FHF complex subunit HOOK-interacting protein C-terminal domain-containing protein n=1 Tax=Amphiprion percula TaxID=161767 RepID=A0A3P8T316_AMPPE